MYGTYSNLFDGQAALYSKFRPTYPRQLFDIIFEQCDVNKESCALDLATGSGQTASHLVQTFEKVIAIDSNTAQLEAAAIHSRISYKQGFAENTGLCSKSVDLVTASQALHWFEIDKAFVEIGRVLKPGGLFAAWCYGVPEVLGNPAASKLIWEFRFADDRLGPYWSQRNKLVDTQYKDIAPPADLFEEPRREKLLGQQKVTVGGLVGFLESWSAYATFKQRDPEQGDILGKSKEEFLELCPAEDGFGAVSIAWPIFLLLTRRKI